MRNKFIVTILIFITIISIIVVYIELPWIILTVYTNFKADPIMPEITKGEFSFYLDYKINEQIFSINDTLKCEYCIGLDGDMNKVINLKQEWLYDTSKYYTHTLYKIDDELIIQYVAPSAEYFMGEIVGKYDLNIPDIYLVNTKTYDRRKMDLNELSEKYRFEVLDFKCDPPIQNSFK